MAIHRQTTSSPPPPKGLHGKWLLPVIHNTVELMRTKHCTQSRGPVRSECTVRTEHRCAPIAHCPVTASRLDCVLII
eukprot:scaffold32085_cov22-Tisochrysis_lutea.AAC.1